MVVGARFVSLATLEAETRLATRVSRRHNRYHARPIIGDFQYINEFTVRTAAILCPGLPSLRRS